MVQVQRNMFLHATKAALMRAKRGSQFQVNIYQDVNVNHFRPSLIDPLILQYDPQMCGPRVIVTLTFETCGKHC